jgi:hypothetical protein
MYRVQLSVIKKKYFVLLKPLIGYSPYTLTYAICPSSYARRLARSRRILTRACVTVYTRHTALSLALIYISVISILVKEFNRFSIF